MASSAGAATEIGTTFDPGTSFCGNFLFQSVSPASDTYAAPFAGVISSWRYQASSGPVQLKLKVGRGAGGTNFTIIGESAVETAAAGTLNAFPTRISVGAGDVIGLTPVTNGLPCIRGMASGYSYSAYVMGSDVPPGSTATFNPPNANVQLDMSAVLEADADGDGFGDETQDQCPLTVGSSAGCPPNTLSLGKLTRHKHAGTASLTVAVPGPGTLTLAGKGIVKQRAGPFTRRRLVAKVVGGGDARLRIKAKRAKRRKLNRSGKVKVVAKITYTPSGGLPNTEAKRIRLVKKG